MIGRKKMEFKFDKCKLNYTRIVLVWGLGSFREIFDLRIGLEVIN